MFAQERRAILTNAHCIEWHAQAQLLRCCLLALKHNIPSAGASLTIRVVASCLDQSSTTPQRTFLSCVSMPIPSRSSCVLTSTFSGREHLVLARSTAVKEGKTRFNHILHEQTTPLTSPNLLRPSCYLDWEGPWWVVQVYLGRLV